MDVNIYLHFISVFSYSFFILEKKNNWFKKFFRGTKLRQSFFFYFFQAFPFLPQKIITWNNYAGGLLVRFKPIRERAVFLPFDL